MELIITNRKGVSFDVVYDAEDHELINNFKWHIQNSGDVYTWIDCSLKIGVSMHRLIMNVTDPEIDVDHINHNRQDNRKCNLRLCSAVENSRNRYSQTGKSSKYKGVCWYKNNKTWRASIGVNYKTIGLGYNKDEKEAARMYDKAAKIYFGVNAVLNFPDE